MTGGLGQSVRRAMRNNKKEVDHQDVSSAIPRAQSAGRACAKSESLDKRYLL